MAVSMHDWGKESEMHDRLIEDCDFRWLRVRDIDIDPRYQRAIRAAEVKQIADDFKADAVGALPVAQRADGRYLAMDGQQRLTVLKLKGYDNVRVPCLVYFNRPSEWEPEFFCNFNGDRTNLTPRDVWKGKSAAGSEMHIDLAEALDELGVTVSSGTDKHIGPLKLNCPGLLMDIAQTDGVEMVRTVLTVIMDAWGDDKKGKDAFRAPIIKSIWSVLHRYGDDINQARLVDRLSQISPRHLIRDARAAAGGRTGMLIRNIAARVVKEYNHGLRNRLPAWPTRVAREDDEE